MDDDDDESLPATSLRVGGEEVTITLDDIRQIRSRLVEHLERAGAPDARALAGWARGPAWIDADAVARIGPWVLDSAAGQVFLRYRAKVGAFAGSSYRALLAGKADGWTVTSLEPEHILRVRTEAARTG